jgi:hypothetical protein
MTRTISELFVQSVSQPRSRSLSLSLSLFPLPSLCSSASAAQIEVGAALKGFNHHVITGPFIKESAGVSADEMAPASGVTSSLAAARICIGKEKEE